MLAGGNDPDPDDINTDITKTTGSRHNVFDIDAEGIHKADETLAEIAADKHVECLDCHNPHAAQKEDRGKGSNLITATSPLLTAKGADFSTTYPAWIDATTYNPNNTTTYTAGSGISYDTATMEYQICFKCHSSANSNYWKWDGNEGTATATEWTDVALEFNPNNQSYHPVVAALPATDPGENGSSQLTAAQLDHGWSPGDTMYCSDCHASESTVAGPHGSTVKWMLAGTNKAWPYIDADLNGSNSATNYREAGSVLFGPDRYLNTDDGLFCRNCHPNTRTSGANKVHAWFNHISSKCVDCHIRVPHGGKVSRLIAADQNATMPDRYFADGEGNNTGGGTTSKIYKFTKQAATAYLKTDCYAGCASGPPPGHGTGTSGTETW